MDRIAFQEGSGYSTAHYTQNLQRTLCGEPVLERVQTDRDHVWWSGRPDEAEKLSKVPLCLICEQRHMEIDAENTWMSPNLVYRSQYRLGNGYTVERVFRTLPEMPRCIDPDDYFPDLEVASIERQQFQVRLHADPYVDGDNCRTVASLWFRSEREEEFSPFMLYVLGGGRKGFSEEGEFITDKARFFACETYLLDLYRQENPCDPDDHPYVDPDEPIPYLHHVYCAAFEPDDFPEGGLVEKLVTDR